MYLDCSSVNLEDATILVVVWSCRGEWRDDRVVLDSPVRNGGENDDRYDVKKRGGGSFWRSGNTRFLLEKTKKKSNLSYYIPCF